MKRSRWLLLGAACAACCAPLFVPLFAASGLAGVGAAGAGWFAGLGLAEIICLAVLAGGVALAVALTLRTHSQKRAQEAAACEVGGACDPHDRR
jgi:prepilin signal peptidase PulO-like enzyme (type II secretory pathway)